MEKLIFISTDYASAYTQERIRKYTILEVIDMTVKDAVARRFKQLCAERNIKTNELATLAGVTPSTVYSMMDGRRRDVSIVTIKKLCDGLDITLGNFFATPEFEALVQEIL